MDAPSSPRATPVPAIPALYRALYRALVRVLRLAIAPANTTEELLNGFLWKISYRRWLVP